MPAAVKDLSYCYTPKDTTRLTRPNCWVVFLRTHKGKFANRDEIVSKYEDDFRAKMIKRLEKLDDKMWTKKYRKMQYHKIICEYFFKWQKKSGKHTQHNKDAIVTGVGKVLAKRSARASLSAIKKIKYHSRPQVGNAKRTKPSLAVSRLKTDLRPQTTATRRAKTSLPVSRLRQTPAKRAKTSLAVSRLKTDLRTPTTRTRPAGASSRSGRPQVKRNTSSITVRTAPGQKKVAKRTASSKTGSTLKLMSHQQSVVDHMREVAKGGNYEETKGLLVAHGMGSGKTLTALSVAKDYIANNSVNSVYIVAPNVAVPEFKNSFRLAGIAPKQSAKIKVCTHDGFAEKTSIPKNSLVIIDEVHLFTKTKYRALVKYDVRYLLLLSGTPCPNQPEDIVPLTNLLFRAKKNRWTEKKWNSVDVSRQQMFLKGKISAYNIGAKHNYIGYIGHSTRVFGGSYPDFRVKTVWVTLQAGQEARYSKLLKKNKKGGSDAKRMHPFFVQERKIVNEYHTDIETTKGIKATPKIVKVATDVVNSINKKNTGENKRRRGGRILVYVHNYTVLRVLKSAIKAMCAIKEKEVAIAEYNGETSESQRQKVKKSFNDGDTDVLIISRAGSVGLDLKCTAKVFLLDVYWNIPTMNQIIGRAIRTNSHDKAKTGCEHKRVDVNVYISSFSGSHRRTKVFDNHILEHAQEKWEDVATMLAKVVQKASI